MNASVKECFDRFHDPIMRQDLLKEYAKWPLRVLSSMLSGHGAEPILVRVVTTSNMWLFKCK